MNININEALDLKKWEEIPKLVLDGEDREDQEENIQGAHTGHISKCLSVR